VAKHDTVTIAKDALRPGSPTTKLVDSSLRVQNQEDIMSEIAKVGQEGELVVAAGVVTHTS
jgi:hypothetical protein